MNKNNYVILYRNLQQSLELEVKLRENTQNTKIQAKRLDETIY